MARKINLIEDWKSAWRYISVQFQAAGLLLMTLAQILGDTWNGMPATLQQKLPHATTIALVLFGLGLIGRVIKITEHEPDASK